MSLRRQHRVDEQPSRRRSRLPKKRRPVLRLLDRRLDVAGDGSVDLRDERERVWAVVPLGDDPVGKAVAVALGEELGRDPRVVPAALEAELGERRRIVPRRGRARRSPRHGAESRPRAALPAVVGERRRERAGDERSPREPVADPVGRAAGAEARRRGEQRERRRRVGRALRRQSRVPTRTRMRPRSGRRARRGWRIAADARPRACPRRAGLEHLEVDDACEAPAAAEREAETRAGARARPGATTSLSRRLRERPVRRPPG